MKRSVPCLKTIDSFRQKGKQTHYSDEKQLVCCQLGAEFTLLEDFAAGIDELFSELRKKIASPRTTLLVHFTPAKSSTLAKARNKKIGKWV